jgi:hypothetical protein
MFLKQIDCQIPEGLIKAYALALNSTLNNVERWNADYFQQFFSRDNPSPIVNRCAMEKTLFILLGLNLRLKKEENSVTLMVDFEDYSRLFDKSIAIMKDLFGDVAEVKLKNDITSLLQIL